MLLVLKLKKILLVLVQFVLETLGARKLGGASRTYTPRVVVVVRSLVVNILVVFLELMIALT